jgi:ketopantoate reductase
LSSGEFVGMVADDPLSKIELKAFHCEIQNDHTAMQKEEAGFKDIEPVRKIDQGMIQRNYEQVKQDVQEIIQSEIEALLADPARAHLVVRK